MASEPMSRKAADALRVIGSHAVHPGEIDTDDMNTVMGLFELLNIMVDDRISQPRRIEAIFAMLPESKRKAIEDRDAQA